jgi:hypothetical protein
MKSSWSNVVVQIFIVSIGVMSTHDMECEGVVGGDGGINSARSRANRIGLIVVKFHGQAMSLHDVVYGHQSFNTYS